MTGIFTTNPSPVPLNQRLPSSQSDWQQILNQLDSWRQILVGSTLQWQAPALLNGWVNFGAPYGTAGVYQDLTKRVWCRGVIKSGTVTDGTQLMTLPYVPAAQVLLTAQAFSGSVNTTVRLDVDTSGNVFLTGAGAFTGAYFISLDQLTFSVVV